MVSCVALVSYRPTKAVMRPHQPAKGGSEDDCQKHLGPRGLWATLSRAQLRCPSSTTNRRIGPMPSENISTANYAAVVADLRTKRDELDRVISLLEAMAQINPASQETAAPKATVAASPQTTPSVSSPHADIKRSNVVGTGIGEKCMTILRDHGNGQPMSTRQVTDILLQSGFELNTKSPPNNVWSALSHRAKVSRDVERAGNKWVYIGPCPLCETQESDMSAEVNGSSVAFTQTTEN